MKASAPTNQKAVVLLIGDKALVDEYTSLAETSHYEVLAPGSLQGLKSKAGKISIAVELSNLDPVSKKNNLVALDKLLPPTTAILTSSITITTLEQSTWLAQKHRLVGIAALPTLLNNSLVEVAPSVHTISSTVDVVRKFFSSLHKEIAVVQDRVGMVLPRILCQVINEAMFAVQQEVAVPADVDTAMQLGMNYPSGPIEWGEKIGFAQVSAVLTALQQDLGEERYRQCPLLKQLAITGKFWR